MTLYLCLTGICLWVLSISDIRTKTIPGWAAPAFGIAMGILHLILSDLTFPSFLAGLIPGAVLVILSLVFRSSLGTGDGLVVLACGAALGLEREFAALCAALIFCAVFCIVLLILKRAQRSDCLPFLPFLAAAHTVMLIGEVIL